MTLAIGPAPEDQVFGSESLGQSESVVQIAVIDTGVGIADDKLLAIFEAFQQADGTTSRKYGGTGLGLSISREIARLLGGEIRVSSEVGVGSRFSLFLPMRERPIEAQPEQVAAELTAGGSNGAGSPSAVQLSDDALDHDDRVMLVVASNPERAQTLVERVHTRGVKAVIARRASASLGLAREHRPEAVLLAAEEPRAESVLAQLKNHPDTRHLPVVLIGDSSIRIASLRTGAAAFLDEPLEADELDSALARLERKTESPGRRIALIAEHDEVDEQIRTLLAAGERVELERIDPQRALAAMREEPFDLGVVIVGPRRGESAPFELLRDVASDEVLRERPLIAYAPGKLPKAERARLDALSKGAVITVADSPERLADRTALFLHRVEATLPSPTRKLLGRLRTGDAPLQGKKVLVIDDDIRNVFALTSTLEARGMKVVYAENGREGIERLHQHPNTDLILLDIMMPEMDGYETARAIRAMPRFEDLPIISLTAKAMKGDREKAIEAGASDYITKPVDVDQLVSMMRVWLDA